MGINLSFQSSTMDHSWFDVVRLHRLKKNRMSPCHDVQNHFGCVGIFSLEDLTNNLGKNTLKQPQRSMLLDHWETTFFRKKTQIAGWKIQCFEWYLPGSTVSLPEGIIFWGPLFLVVIPQISPLGFHGGAPPWVSIGILRKGDGVLDIGSQGCC